MKEKEIITLDLDFLEGPILLSDIETGDLFTGIAVIDNDAEIKRLNKKFPICIRPFGSCMSKARMSRLI